MSVLPHGWTEAPVSLVADVNPPQPEELVSDESLVSFVPMASVQEESGVLDPSQLRPWRDVRKGYTRFQEGDVLFAKITPCMENGKFALAKGLHGGVGAGSTEFHVLRPRVVRPNYLLNFLLQSSIRRDARLIMKGAAGQLRVPTSFFDQINIPVAPLEQQDRIVAEIEKQFTRLDAATAALKRVQANLKRYRASVLKAACEGRLVRTEAELARKERRDYEPADQLLQRILRERRARWEADTLAKMIASGKPPEDDHWKQKYKEPACPHVANLPALPEGWCWATLQQLTSLITSGSRGWGELYSESGPLFIRAQDIKTDSLKVEDAARVQLTGNGEGTRTLVQRFDLLVTITGANVTRTALVTHEIEEAYVSQHVGLVRPVISETSHYLYHWIISPMQGRAELLRLAYGAGKPGLNLENLRELLIALPPGTEQLRIQSELSRIMSTLVELDSTVNRAAQHSSGLRTSILQRAFAGELLPQNPNDEPTSVLLQRIHAQTVATPRGRRTDGHSRTEPETVEVS